MGDNHSLQKSAARVVLHRLLRYVDKSPEENLEKLADRISSFFGNLFPPENFEKMKRVAAQSGSNPLIFETRCIT